MYKAVMRVIVQNKEFELYTIGKVSEVVGKSVETIRAWERQKVIPPPLFKSKRVRLYHPDEANTMKRVLKKLGKGAKKREIQEEMWKELSPVRKGILNEAKGNKEKQNQS